MEARHVRLSAQDLYSDFVQIQKKKGWIQVSTMLLPLSLYPTVNKRPLTISGGRGGPQGRGNPTCGLHGKIHKHQISQSRRTMKHTRTTFTATHDLVLGSVVPMDIVRVRRRPSASELTLRPLQPRMSSRPRIMKENNRTYQRVNQDGVVQSSNPARVQRVQIKHLNTLHCSKGLQPIQTSRLAEIRRDLTGFRAFTEQ